MFLYIFFVFVCGLFVVCLHVDYNIFLKKMSQGRGRFSLALMIKVADDLNCCLLKHAIPNFSHQYFDDFFCRLVYFLFVFVVIVEHLLCICEMKMELNRAEN